MPYDQRQMLLDMLAKERALRARKTGRQDSRRAATMAEMRRQMMSKDQELSQQFDERARMRLPEMPQ